MLRLAYPADVEALLTRPSPTRRCSPGSTSGLAGWPRSPRWRWAAMPAQIDPVTRDRFLGDAAGIGVDLVGAWIDGNGIAPVILGVERVLG